jgi:hypothetical protein
VADGDADDARFGVDDDRFAAVEVGGEPHERGVHRALAQGRGLAAPVEPLGHHPESAARELGAGARGELPGAARLESDPQHPAGLVPFGGRGDPVGGGERVGGRGQDLGPGGGRGDSGGRAVEQAHPEFGFESLERVGERGLADVQGLRGPPEVPVLADRREVPQLPQLHAAIISRVYGPVEYRYWTPAVL